MNIGNVILGIIMTFILLACDFVIFHWLEWIWSMPTAVASVGTVWGFFVMIPVFIAFIIGTISVINWTFGEVTSP